MGTRRSRLLLVTLSACVVVLAVSGPGIQASASPAHGPGRWTRQGIDEYLGSRGINAGAAIWQTGQLNYVGAGCPGKGWTCIAPTHTPIVQMAPAGGINVYNCSAGPGDGPGGCFALQINGGAPPAGGSAGASRAVPGNPAAAPAAGNNQYTCHEQVNSGDSVTLDSSGCSVNQVNTTGNNLGTIQQTTQQQSTDTQTAAETAGSSLAPLSQVNQAGNNQLTIQQQSQQSSSDAPTAAQTTYISQANGTGQNQATIQQQVQQQVNDAAAAQDQEATQVACVTQDSPSGQNQANVNQQLTQHEQDSASGITQNQNEHPGPTSTCGSGDGEATTTIDPNLAALVLQDENTPAATGHNQETVKQSLQQQEQSQAGSGTVAEVQGFNVGGFGGLEAIPDQNSAGVSQVNTAQDEQQSMHARTTGSLFQDQYDPIYQPPGEGVQGTNPSDAFQLSQQATQQAGPDASQNYAFAGDCSSSGTCDVQQTVTTNAGPIHQSCPPSPEALCATALNNESE